MSSTSTHSASATLLPPELNPKSAGDQTIAALRSISPVTVKGAHDADFLIHEGKAYVVYEANDVQPGENAEWSFIYCALTIVDLANNEAVQTLNFAASEQRYANETLPAGACFVPRIIQKDDRTLRCFFASEDPGKRQAQTWYLDFDIPTARFDDRIYRAELATSQGVFPMQPRYLYEQAVAEGFTHPACQHGLYLIDSFKQFDGRWHAVLNNFAIRQNAWAELNPDMNRFTVLGNFFEPADCKFSEAAVTRLSDDTWLAIARQESQDQNYLFFRSHDGQTWTAGEPLPVVTNGTTSKPTLDRFSDGYYLGWQEATRINSAFRSVFNLEFSLDGHQWERRYRFESDKSFQYPIFREHKGVIYVAVTQGDFSDKRKERIMFGALKPV